MCNKKAVVWNRKTRLERFWNCDYSLKQKVVCICAEKNFTLKGALSGLRQFLATDSPLKMMKNAFYFTSRSLSILKIFKFLSWLFVHEAKWLDKKGKVNFSFFDVIAWLTIVIHILPNISTSKGNQAMKYGQLIECNMRNIFFFEKSYAKCGVETSPRPFSEKLKIIVSLDQ